DGEHRSDALQRSSFESLKDGDWLCVLDMGGGTTDISFGQLAIDATGAPAFTEMHTLGFADKAGDCIDREFYRWCVGRWVLQKRLKGMEGDAGPLSELGMDDLVHAAALMLEGEPAPVRRDEALRQLCILKESMFAQATPVNKTWDSFLLQHNHVLLAPGEISQQIRKRVAEPI